MIKQNVAFSSVQDTASYPWCRKPRGSRGVGGVGGAPCGGRRTWTIDQPRAAELRGTGQQRGVAGRLRPAPRRPRTASRLFPAIDPGPAAAAAAAVARSLKTSVTQRPGRLCSELIQR